MNTSEFKNGRRADVVETVVLPTSSSFHAQDRMNVVSGVMVRLLVVKTIQPASGFNRAAGTYGSVNSGRPCVIGGKRHCIRGKRILSGPHGRVLAIVVVKH